MSTEMHYLTCGGTNPELLNHCQAIRRIVFVEGQGVAETIDFDGKDDSSSHLLLLHEDSPVGTLRIRKTEKGMKLERIAVLPAFRGRGYGELLVKAGLSKAEGSIYINAQVSSQGFYEHVGFVVEDGTIFDEAGIDHIVMIWPHGRGSEPCAIVEQ